VRRCIVLLASRISCESSVRLGGDGLTQIVERRLKPRASDSMKFREVFIIVPLCSTSCIRSTALKSKNHLCVKKKLAQYILLEITLKK
jgi:hypothetical protein